MLGPTCNHDLGVLLRMSSSAGGDTVAGGRDAVQQRKDASDAMLDSMGDHEYYCAAYSSKQQPHVEGLMETLSTAVRKKEEQVAEAKDKG